MELGDDAATTEDSSVDKMDENVVGATSSQRSDAVPMDEEDVLTTEPVSQVLSSNAAQEKAQTGGEAEEEEEGEDETDVFATYEPVHMGSQGAPSHGFDPPPRAHPSPLVETASLRSIVASPPRFPLADSLGEVARAGLLSAAQLESVICACEAHSWRIRGAGVKAGGGGGGGEDGGDGSDDRPNIRFRAGFLLGDGAGVGKVTCA